ncbi:MAG: hypothetical protein ACOC6C_01590 [Verrucomicrobiota bacterium]
MNKTVLSWFSKARIVVSTTAYIIAIGFLSISVLIFAWMWIRALAMGALPEGDWGTTAGNHGPWRRLHELRSMWYGILELQWWSLSFAITSYAVKPRLRTAITVVVAFIALFLFFYTHYWLVD